MPVTGKELERQLTPEEIARQQVEGYIERVEKEVEVPAEAQQYVSPSGQVTLPKPVADDFGQAVMEAAQAKEAEYHLSLTEAKVAEGLHHPLVDALRWAAEQCIYLIKKYPGRVFYSRE